VIPASDTMNWVKKSAAIAGAMWVIACIVAPVSPRAPCLRPLWTTRPVAPLEAGDAAWSRLSADPAWSLSA
jgi:hypothetical protein